ncbi:hypothetical protein MD484_g5541, partial [Candolleomyces efflorescens]
MSARRDVRMHDPSPAPGHPHIVPHIPSTPNGHHATISPAVAPSAVPNGQPQTVLQKISQANEQTWLLIGKQSPPL